jgi:iron complex transport system substrate-binding protein
MNVLPAKIIKAIAATTAIAVTFELAGCAVPTPAAPAAPSATTAPVATSEPTLAPTVAPAEVTTKDIVDTAIAAGGFKTLVAAVQAAGLVDVLKSEGPFTVFAPTDEAFARLDKATLDDLLKPENKDKLVTILTYHVVPGKVTAADAAKFTTAKTVQGEDIAIKAEGGVVTINDAKVVQADVVASNGVIHVIDTVLMPPTTNGQVAPTGASRPVVVKDLNGNDVEIKDTSRIVSLGGSVTEIVFALGVGDRVVGVDTSSTYPKDAVEALPKVGYQRRLAAEGVLSLKPTLILATDQAGPPEAIQQLRDSGVTVLILKAEESVEGAKAKIMGFGMALGKQAEAEALVRQLDEDIEQANELLKQVESQPKVMFIYARGAGTAQVAGTNTGAHAMIELAGAKNAVTEYERYKPLTAEAAVAAAPDVILMLSNGLKSVGGVDGLLKEPGIAQTPAGQNRRIVDMDDEYLLSFGPRMGKAVIDLIYLLHPELKR